MESSVGMGPGARPDAGSILAFLSYGVVRHGPLGGEGWGDQKEIKADRRLGVGEEPTLSPAQRLSWRYLGALKLPQAEAVMRGAMLGAGPGPSVPIPHPKP